MGDRMHQHLDNISAGDLCEPLEQLVIPAIREHWSWSPLTNAPSITSKSWLASLSGGRTPIDSSVMIVFTALLSSPPKCIAMASHIPLSSSQDQSLEKAIAFLRFVTGLARRDSSAAERRCPQMNTGAIKSLVIAGLGESFFFLLGDSTGNCYGTRLTD
jgi:hypothetical protein